MFRVMDDLPASVVGVEAVGEIQSADYTEVIDPLIESATAGGKKVRLLYVVGDEFKGYSGAAAWQDAKLGVEHFSSFERLALVTDHKWLGEGVHAVGWILPGEWRVFELSDRAAAVEWLAGP